ncbi:N-acetylmuramoyl-L-alanine amidase [Phaeovulum sp. W22_SRMD_FR3]|uniref:N-acetylmuramoyl-L-alanine amidase n=1 Tax=Phaeovulum sp. W22_SRMD_FR3 TaxID=3240274 RepID=UPI003F9AC2EF
MAPSPNFGPRRAGALPSLIVLHYTAMASAGAARARLCDPQAEVSAHWLVDEAGRAEALVPEAMRAWHAGAGAWGPVTDVNSHSIGIELANPGDRPFPERQMAALEDLLRGIMARWAIPPERVIGHSDMAPGRKIDPGPRFDWRRLALQGLAVWPEAAPPERQQVEMRQAADAAAPLGQSLALLGYPPAEPEILLSAFRLRFRPGATGPETAEDRRIAACLAAAHPVASGRFAIDGTVPSA